MPLTILSDEDGKLTIIQTGNITADDPVLSIEMEYAKWPVEISLNMMENNHKIIVNIDTNTNDPDKKLKDRESPTNITFDDVENFADAAKIFNLKSITPDVIAILSEKFEIAKSHRPKSPKLTMF